MDRLPIRAFVGSARENGSCFHCSTQTEPRVIVIKCHCATVRFCPACFRKINRQLGCKARQINLSPNQPEKK